MEKTDFIFRSFASGSSGNCYYLGTLEQGVLIDAGISARQIHRDLRDMGLDFPAIMGVLVTHDHADHIRAVGTLGEKIHIPIYATANIHAGIDRNYGVTTKLRTARKFFEKGVPFQLAGMTINTFNVSHDSTECVGYVIDFHEHRFVICTDCGDTSDEMAEAIRTANHIVIEANHDEQMLLNGPYPTYLKQRILSPRGHQSNDVCGEMLAENFHDGIRHVFLCHLSEDNNTPERAGEVVKEYLESVGAVLKPSLGGGERVLPGELFMTPLNRTEASPIYVL
ncbi:MAG: MBL fold metallo-hydrolase [Paludibacteraceae bacterium]|nr:MBL fold metallo-hydrolase [Paludibacteraceae bacterium]